VSVVLVEAGHDRQAVVNGGRRIAIASRRRAAGQVASAKGRAVADATGALRIGLAALPKHPVAHVGAGGVLPAGTSDGQEPEPVQQVKGVGPQGE
jgi:hypothetical protein